MIEKSQLNVLLYGSNEFNDERNIEIILRIIPNRTADTGVAEGAHGHPIFWVAKRKKKNEEKKRVSKQKLLKCCHQGENVTVLVMFTVLF